MLDVCGVGVVAHLSVCRQLAVIAATVGLDQVVPKRVVHTGVLVIILDACALVLAVLLGCDTPGAGHAGGSR
jgi:hypothetical protein